MSREDGETVSRPQQSVPTLQSSSSGIRAAAHTQGPITIDELCPTIASGPIRESIPPIDDGLLVNQDQRYERGSLLGAGGMGEVQQCRDRVIGRTIAFKTYHPIDGGDEELRRRFLREVRIQGQLEHPSIVPVYDIGISAQGSPYFTMRRIQGQSLEEVLAGLSAKAPEIVAAYSRHKLLHAFLNICHAVHYAHTKGIVHRDLKPANVMLGEFGEVYVLDWGIAKPITEAASQDQAPSARFLTGDGHVIGTPGYMAPEQAAGMVESLDGRADVYALGAMLFEILTYRPLHQGDNIVALAQSTMTRVDARASKVVPNIAPELDAILERATQTNRDDRYGTARELAEAIERYLDGDRDMERRRALAGEHATLARSALDRVHEPSCSHGEQSEALSRAMREVTTALAFDPENVDARRLLVRLLTDVPPRLPPAIEAQRDHVMDRSRAHAARYGFFTLLSWTGMIPWVFVLGIRSYAAIGLASVLVLAAVAHNYWIWKNDGFSRKHRLLLATLVLATVSATSCWLGPFVLVPVAAAATTLWFGMQAERVERWIIMGVGTVSVVVPFLLEAAGLVPPSYEFRDGDFVLLSRALELDPTLTILSLLYTTVTFVILPGLFFGGIRDKLAEVETKLHLQAWQLRQLAAEHQDDAP